MEKYRVVGAKQQQCNGKIFRAEFLVDCLPEEACKGNFAARNALDIEGYKHTDAPFFYGKVDALGYVFAGKNLVRELEDSSDAMEG